MWATSGLRVDTNLLSLLPRTERDPVLIEAVDLFTRRLSSKTLFLVGHASEAAAQSAADQLIHELEESGLFTGITGRVDSGRAFFDLYFPYRYQLLAEPTRQQLEGNAEAGADLIREAEQALYNPTSSLYAALLEDDPLLLFASFLKGLPKPPGQLKLRNGYLSAISEGMHCILIAAEATSDSFSRRGQKKTEAFILDISRQLRQQTADLSFHSTGVIRYAAAGGEAAESEISTIGVGSLLGVILLFILAFGSVRPLLLGLLPILIGLLAALLACFTVFGRVHLITLGFGASLIGICIDYTFHYYCELGSEGKTPQQVMRSILPAISMGALTSIMGYLGLFVAPFPGLRQMALFSAVGLLAAFGTVVMVFPQLSGRGSVSKGRLMMMAQSYLNCWNGLSVRTLTLLGLMLALLLAIGLSRLQSDDDIRRLQPPSAQLRLEESYIRSLVGGLDTSRFLLVEGASPEEVLTRQEQLSTALAKLRVAGKLSYFQGLNTMLPSKARQRKDHQLLAQAMQSEVLESYLMGFQESIAESARQALSLSPTKYLELEEWLASRASDPLKHLWLGATERGYAGMMVLGGITDDSPRLLAETREGVYYIDKVDDISQLMRRYRELGAKLVALSYLAIFLILVWRHGYKVGLLVSLPPMLAAGLSLAVFGLLGEPVNLFNVLGLLLVLGIGIDYTIFFAELGGNRPSTMLAVMLSACTTILSFGLLAASTTPVLHGFGLTVLMGICAGWLLSPLAARR